VGLAADWREGPRCCQVGGQDRVKSAIQAAEEGSETAVESLRVAVKRPDKAASRGIIHKHQASNRQARLMRRINRIDAG
jgi:small subunit ribosomal protein S20